MAEIREVVLSISCLVIALISIVGNSLVCHVILRVKSMKTSMNYLLLNLAVVDTIISVIAICKTILDDNSGLFGTAVALEQLYRNRTALTDEVICKVKASFWGSASISPFLLVIIAYERYKAIVHPLSRVDSGITKERLKWILPFSWLWGIGFLTHDVTLSNYSPEEGLCYLKKYPGFHYRAFLISYVTLQFVIPAIMILVLYSRVIHTIRKAKVTAGLQAEVQRARNRGRKRVILVVIIVTLAFFIFCGVPNIIYVLNEFFVLSYWLTFGDFATLSITFNSAANPIIYFIFIKSFQDALKSICKPALTRDNGFIETPSTTYGGGMELKQMKPNGMVNERTENPQLLSFGKTTD